MEVFIFIVVLVALIVVHEFGHLIAAKWSGMRVDEFGIGYPPRALTLGKIGETVYTLNWLPFGGFVKIFGEDAHTPEAERDPRAFSSRPRILQAFVLAAGVTMNLLFAYVLITAALVAGAPRALAPEEVALATEVQLAVANVLPGSPAANAGVLPGDILIEAAGPKGTWHAADADSFTNFISANGSSSVELTVLQGAEEKMLTVTPAQGIAPTNPARYALGVEVATVGVLPRTFFEALTDGASLTWSATKLTAIGLANFFYGILTFNADLSQVAGPVGIAGAVGDASSSSLHDLLSLMAIISINLALINLIPVPALDGGRLLFVIIESIIRRPIKPTVAQAVNGIGFAALLLLMVVITVHDIIRLS